MRLVFNMYLEVKLPDVFISNLEIRGMKNGSIFMNASNLEELHTEFRNKYPALLNKIWNEQGEIRKNLLLVVNDNLINKIEYNILKFPDHTKLEIMTQFAGG